MTKIDQSDLEDILMRFAMEPARDRATLERYLQDYPAHTDDLVSLSMDLRLQEAKAHATAAIDETTVEAAWQRYRSGFAHTTTDIIKDPFAAVDQSKLVALRKKLGVPSAVIHGLRSCMVDPVTIPETFLRELADQLGESLQKLGAYLSGPPQRHGQLAYKAEDAPKLSDAKISFEQLLLDSRVSDEKRERLLSGEK